MSAVPQAQAELRQGDQVRFSRAYARNHDIGSPAHVVGFDRVGTIRRTGDVPAGPKAGVPFVDVDFPVAEGRIAMRIQMFDRARFERAPEGRRAQS